MNRHCFLFGRTPAVTIRRTAALGDSLASTVVAEKLANLGYEVTFQSNPANHCVLRRHKAISRVEPPEGTPHVNLDDVYEKHPQRTTRHFSDLFMEAANEQLRARGLYLGPPINCRPRLQVKRNERAVTLARFQPHDHPWIFICPRSNAWAVRTVPDYIWGKAAASMPGTKFWLGTTPAPAGIVDLHCRHIDNLILWLSVADMLVTVDTGPMHIAAALGVPIIALGQSSSPDLHLSDQVDFRTVWAPNLDCLNCQKNICPKAAYQPPCQNFHPMEIAEAVGHRCRAMMTEDVSAIVAVYRPDTAVLNKCLDHILPQVSEVIVVRDQAGKFPDGAGVHPKIKYIVKDQRDIGYGRKANYGARHANGRYLLFLNDDLYAGPNMVEKLRNALSPGVAVTAPLLRFKDGRIQHAGMVRAGDGGVGFGHIDYGRYQPTFTETREVECVTGAAILVDRTAFYRVNGLDEEFYLYCEDTDFMMKIRQAGYKILYVAQAEGIHDEHLSTGKTPNIVQIMNKSNGIFGRKWKWYFEHNRSNTGLGVFG